MLEFKLSLLLLLAALVSLSAAREVDTCNFSDPALKRLCRQVASQDQYDEKMVDILYKTDTVFRWFVSNKEWLQHPRLGRMMKRLLRKATLLNQGDSDVDSDDAAGAGPSAAAFAEIELKVQAITSKMMDMEQELMAAKKQVQALEVGQKMALRAQDLESFNSKVNTSLAKYEDLILTSTSLTSKALATVQMDTLQLAARFNQTDKVIESLQNSTTGGGGCNCTQDRLAFILPSRAVVGSERAAEQDQTAADNALEEKLYQLGQDVYRAQDELKRDVNQLKDQVRFSVDDVNRVIVDVRTANEQALRNFSQNYQENLKMTIANIEERVAERSRVAYDIIVNTTVSFGEDLQLIRMSVSNTSTEIHHLMSQDLRNTRGLEDLRSSNRRHDANIQTLNNQLTEFKNNVQDQLASIRSSFMQTILEFYNKIVERQNQMSYRLSSIVDDLSSVKGRIRNFPNSNNKERVDNNEDDQDPLPELPDSK